MSDATTYASAVEYQVLRIPHAFLVLLIAGLVAPSPAPAAIGPICAMRFEQVMTDAVGCRLREEAKSLKKGKPADFSKCQRKTSKGLYKVTGDRRIGCSQLTAHFGAFRSAIGTASSQLVDSLHVGMDTEIANQPKCQALRLKHTSLLARCRARNPYDAEECEARFAPKYDGVSSRGTCGVPIQDSTSAAALMQIAIDELAQTIDEQANPTCPDQISCGAGEVCVDGACVEQTCTPTNGVCGAGELCVDGACVDNSCNQLTGGCATGEICVEGACVEDLCATSGLQCEAFSRCEQDSTGAQCGACPHGYEPDPVTATGCRPLLRVSAAPVYLGASDPPSCGVRLTWKNAMEVGVPDAVGYEIFRDGVHIADRAIPIYEDWTAGPGEHSYTVVSIHADGTRTLPSPPATISNLGCDFLTDPDGYRVTNPVITAHSWRCTSSQVTFNQPEVSTFPVWGLRYFINGKQKRYDVTDYGGFFPAQDGWGGTDRMRPGSTNVYSFAPYYDEAATKIGPMREATVDVLACNELGNMEPTELSVLIARPRDFPEPEPFDVDWARGLMDDYPHSARAYLHEVTYGQLQTNSTVFDWLELPGTIESYCPETRVVDGVVYGFLPRCDTNAMEADARAAAASQYGFDSAHFDNFVYVFDGTTRGGYGGGNVMTLSSQSFNVETVVHEFGHNLGLAHSGFWQCSSAPEYVGEDIYDPRSGGCWNYVYGAGYDSMAVRIWHYNAYHKLMAGILDESAFERVETPGTYTLKALATDSPTGTMGLRIPLYGDVYYLLEYRQARGFDSLASMPDYVGIDRPPMVEGVAVWLVLDESRTGGDSYIIQDGSFQLMVRPGVDFYDPYRGIRVSWIEQSGDDHARISIEFE